MAYTRKTRKPKGASAAGPKQKPKRGTSAGAGNTNLVSSLGGPGATNTNAADDTTLQTTTSAAPPVVTPLPAPQNCFRANLDGTRVMASQEDLPFFCQQWPHITLFRSPCGQLCGPAAAAKAAAAAQDEDTPPTFDFAPLAVRKRQQFKTNQRDQTPKALEPELRAEVMAKGIVKGAAAKSYFLLATEDEGREFRKTNGY